MKQLFYFLIFSLCLIACKEKEELPSPEASSASKESSFREGTNCQKEIEKTQDFLTGHDSTKGWVVYYFVDSSGSAVVHPAVDTINGTLYVYERTSDSTGNVKEYFGGNMNFPPFNTGTYRIGDCGNTLFVNTQILANDHPVHIVKSNPAKYTILIDFPFFGPNGETVRIRGEARPWSGN